MASTLFLRGGNAPNKKEGIHSFLRKTLEIPDEASRIPEVEEHIHQAFLLLAEGHHYIQSSMAVPSLVQGYWHQLSINVRTTV